MTRGIIRCVQRNFIALLALFLALGGTSFAAASYINGSQIKPNSIPKNRLTNSAIKALKGQRGAPGAHGAQGAKGDKGDTGPVGPATGPAGGALTGNYPNPGLAPASVGGANLKSVTFVQGTGVPVTNGSSAEATVTCPAGTRLLSGGPEWGGDTAGTSIIYAVPSPTGDPNTTLVVKGRVATGATNNTIFAEAACIAG